MMSRSADDGTLWYYRGMLDKMFGQSFRVIVAVSVGLSGVVLLLVDWFV